MMNPSSMNITAIPAKPRQAAIDLTSYTPKPQQATGLRAAEGNLMVDHNVGVTVSQKYEVKRLDVAYFEAE